MVNVYFSVTQIPRKMLQCWGVVLVNMRIMKSTKAIKSEMGTVEGVVTVILPQPHQLHCPPHLKLKLKMIHTQQTFSSL